MLWGSKQVQDFHNVVKPGYATCAYGPNEPNLASQSNLDPNSAAQLWMQYILPLAQQGYNEFYTPAPTSAPDGATWLQNFIDACIGCWFNGMNLHIYATNSADMINYLTLMYNKFNMTIQVTEFACQSFTPGEPQCTQDQAFAFMSNVTQWMDQTPFITKYFAYGFMTDINIEPVNQLINQDGTPTALGRLYIGS